IRQPRAPASKGLRFMALPRSGLWEEDDLECDPDHAAEQLPKTNGIIRVGEEFTYTFSPPDPERSA
ncbi:MAG: hypothetical protein ACREPD_17605, partial [Stenotrophomonas sp.]|uniref:hypothetical protein n=1 Tax=Stenotrophomonas sp. TaxID=69392 RepID=UPI003D6D8CC4